MKDISAALLAHHRRHASCPVISMEDAGGLIDLSLALLYPQRAVPRLNTEAEMNAALGALSAELTKLLNMICFCNSEQARVVPAFLGALPRIAEAAMEDAKAAVAADPAAHDLDEVILAYPGIYAIAAYRIAHLLAALGVELLPRLITEFAHRRTGIDINPGARIGHSFFIDHGTSVVIGETAIIGNNVKIYQGVTLGAASVSKAKGGAKRHPTIEDDVVIYANATILGGDTVIGKGAVIGGNVWITKSVPAGARVMYQSAECHSGDQGGFI